jgi:nitrite reductase/ring-hydroxylating ferredoxin subunit
MEIPEGFVKLVKADTVVEGQPLITFVGIKRVAVYRVDDTIHCTQNLCPHAGAHLGRGELRGTVIVCPRHQWGFDIATGECLTDGTYDIQVFPTRLGEDGYIYAEVTSR